MNARALGLITLAMAILGTTIVFAQTGDEEFRDVLDEVLNISKRDPACMVDANGLPKRVLVTRNGVGLFAKPGDKDPVANLGIYRRLYLYVENRDGFHRVGEDPWGEGTAGWIPTDFCILWDHNEMLFLDQKSVPDDVNRVYFWATEPDAREGDPSTAIEKEDIDRSKGKVNDLPFPVLEKDRTGTLYKVGFIVGGEAGALDQSGSKLTRADQQQIVENISVVNVMLVMDATGSMGSYIEEAKAKATRIVEALEGLDLRSITADREPIDVTVNVGLTAYSDDGDAFVAKPFVSLTNDPSEIKRQISSVTADEGGDTPEQVVKGIEEALKDPKFQRGALNRIVLIGDAPDHETNEEKLNAVGQAAKGRYVQIDALVCGGASDVETNFAAIATSSGGKIHPIEDAGKFIELMLKDLKTRAAGIPIEKHLAEEAIRTGSFETAAQGLLGTDKQLRMMLTFLGERGADIAPAKATLRSREGWVKVRPGTGARFKVHSYMPRWQLANHISGLLGSLEEAGRGKDLAENAKKATMTFLGLEAGDKAMAGLSTEDKTVAERGGALPEMTDGVRRGEAGVSRFARAYRDKALGLIDYWRSPLHQEHDHIWVPLELLP